MAQRKTFRYENQLKIYLWRGKQGLPSSVTLAELWQKLDKWVLVSYGVSLRKENEKPDDGIAFEYALSRCLENLPEDLQRKIMAEYTRRDVLSQPWEEIED